MSANLPDLGHLIGGERLRFLEAVVELTVDPLRQADRLGHHLQVVPRPFGGCRVELAQQHQVQAGQ